jgi:hypothetical protein
MTESSIPTARNPGHIRASKNPGALQAIEPVLPPPDDSHPLGCHNPRVPDEVCFRGC